MIATSHSWSRNQFLHTSFHQEILRRHNVTLSDGKRHALQPLPSNSQKISIKNNKAAPIKDPATILTLLPLPLLFFPLFFLSFPTTTFSSKTIRSSTSNCNESGVGFDGPKVVLLTAPGEVGCGVLVAPGYPGMGGRSS
mmetsp:Transcript_37250/g.60789  ORF Transcript_37250/g.60789 Transcript_37250/m.60789 type:complete len:139 (+) Transcript_37250:398-814(+)